MPRVVITGMGIVSSIGNDKDAVLESLRNGRSGLVSFPEMERAGFPVSYTHLTLPTILRV